MVLPQTDRKQSDSSLPPAQTTEMPRYKLPSPRLPHSCFIEAVTPPSPPTTAVHL